MHGETSAASGQERRHGLGRESAGQGHGEPSSGDVLGLQISGIQLSIQGQADLSDGKASSHRPSLPSASARDQTEPVRYAALKDKLATFPARQSFKTRMFRSATGILGMGMESHSRLSGLATQAPAEGTPSRPGSPGSSSANARSWIGNEHAGLHGRGISEAIGSRGARYLPFLRVGSTSTQYCQEPELAIQWNQSG